MSWALQRNLFKAVKRENACNLAHGVSCFPSSPAIVPAPDDEVPCPVSYFRGGLKGNARLPIYIYIYLYIHTYIYTHIYVYIYVCFLFIFLSFPFALCFPRPTDRQFVSFVRCSFATMFFNVKTLRLRSAGPSFPPSFLCRPSWY